MIPLNKQAIEMVNSCINRGTIDEKVSWEMIKSDLFGTNRYKIRDKEWPELTDYMQEIERIAHGKAIIKQEHTGIIKFCYEISRMIFERIKDG
jgi:hypothetical protein